MMHQTGNFLSCRPHNIDARVLQMNFTGDALSMLIFLPLTYNGLMEVEKNIQHFNFSKCFKGKRPEETVVSLPKFEVRTKFEMKSIMDEIGVQDTFTNDADFSELTDYPLYVDKIYHESVIKIDERGKTTAGSSGTVAVE